MKGQITRHERKPGYYWVRTAHMWTVARWYDDDLWLIPGIEGPFFDCDLLEIDEQCITRKITEDVSQKGE